LTQEVGLNLEGVPASLRQAVERYAGRVRSLAGSSAEALVLFGSVAAGSFDPKSHTARSVLIVDRIDLEMLRQLAKEGPAFGKLRIAAPLVMTPNYINASANTFPLEFLEIKQNHFNVFGHDYFAELVLSETDMRHECERELKTVLLAMRQALLTTTGRDNALTDIELDIGERILRALRGMLWLQGDRDPKAALSTIAAAEAAFERALPGVRGAIDSRAPHGWEEFKALYADVEAVGTNLDAW